MKNSTFYNDGYNDRNNNNLWPTPPDIPVYAAEYITGWEHCCLDIHNSIKANTRWLTQHGYIRFINGFTLTAYKKQLGKTMRIVTIAQATGKVNVKSKKVWLRMI